MSQREDTLEGLAWAYQQSTQDSERSKLVNKTSAFLLNSKTAKRMVGAMLFKKGKRLNRGDDALQDATILYVMKVLPILENPQGAWGAFKGAINIVGHRLGASFYDSERSALTSIDSHVLDNDESAERRLRPSEVDGGDTEIEDRILDKMTAEKAKLAINEALLTAKMEGKNALRWLPKLSEAGGAPALPRPELLAEDHAPIFDEKPPKVQPSPHATSPGHEPEILPVVRALGRSGTAEKLDDLPPVKLILDPDVIEERKIPVTDEYTRLVEIRDRTGIAVPPYAKALNIGVPRLRSYLNRKCRVHPEVLARAEQWYRRTGIHREESLNKLKQCSLPELIDTWKDATQARSYAALAGIIGISVPTMTRWRKPGAKPMHDSHLYDAAQKVERYVKARSSSRETA